MPIARLAAAQAAIARESEAAAKQPDLKEKVEAAKTAVKEAIDEAELNEKVESAKTALKEAADKYSAIVADKAEDLKDVAAAAWKSLKAGWEEAKKTFDQEKK